MNILSKLAKLNHRPFKKHLKNLYNTDELIYFLKLWCCEQDMISIWNSES